MGSLEHGIGIERQAGVDFGGDPARDHLEDLLAHGNAKTVAGQADITLAVADAGAEQVGITGNGRSLEQQRGVGGGIHRLDPGDGVEVAGVGHHGGDFLQLFQLGSHERALSYGSDDITRALAGAQGRGMLAMAPKTMT